MSDKQHMMEDDLEFEGDEYIPEEDDDDEMAVEGMDEGDDENETKVYLPGEQHKEGEALVMDKSAYVAHCEFTTEWPCLSFAVLRDHLGENRNMYPMTSYMVAGTQAVEVHQNQVIVMKLSNVHKMSEDEDDDDDDEQLPLLEHKVLKHRGGVNRITVAPQQGAIAATWADTGKVHIWDLSQQVAALESASSTGKLETKPIHTCDFHHNEGFALGWSPVTPYRLASGDCSGKIHLWQRHETGDFSVSRTPCTGHSGSVEDIHWSPSEANVFASCSVDKTVKIWDSRADTARPAISIQAHDCDVNVMSWNRKEQHLMVTGGDDGMFKVWDLRTFMSGKPEAVASFKWHTAPITSIEWHPTDPSVVAVAGEDNQVSLWDLAVEEDTDAGSEEVTTKDGTKVPPQLLFIHQGQTDIKETHWHPQIPGLLATTAADGFNVFKTISV